MKVLKDTLLFHIGSRELRANIIIDFEEAIEHIHNTGITNPIEIHETNPWRPNKIEICDDEPYDPKKDDSDRSDEYRESQEYHPDRE